MKPEGYALAEMPAEKESTGQATAQTAVHLDCKLAMKKLVREENSGNNPVPDILGFLHLKHLPGYDPANRIQDLFEQFERKSLELKPLLKMDVPKPNYTVRPMARPVTEEWLLYEAATEILASSILKDPSICRNSFSVLRFRDKLEGTEPWVRFDKHSRKLYASRYPVAIKTDITGFYENISLKELQTRIYNYLDETNVLKQVANLISFMLHSWSRPERIEGYGLPQGPPGSAFYAEIYLDSVDRAMEKYPGYHRYSDDIRIFVTSDREGKLALKDLTVALRDLKLHVNAKKTEILREAEIKKLFNPQKDLMDLIKVAMDSKEPSRIREVVPHLRNLVLTGLAEDPFEKTYLSFSLWRLSQIHKVGIDIGAGEIMTKIQERFVQKPHHAAIFCNFLTTFHKEESTARFLISFLKGEDNIYEWQELKALQCLVRLTFAATDDEVNFFLDRAKDSNKHFIVRTFYFLLAGRFGKNRDRDVIARCYDVSLNVSTKLGIVLAVQELPARDTIYSKILSQDKDTEVSTFVKYVKSLKNPIYWLDPIHPSPELFSELQEKYDVYSA